MCIMRRCLEMKAINTVSSDGNKITCWRQPRELLSDATVCHWVRLVYITTRNGYCVFSFFFNAPCMLKLCLPLCLFSIASLNAGHCSIQYNNLKNTSPLDSTSIHLLNQASVMIQRCLLFIKALNTELAIYCTKSYLILEYIILIN